MILEPTIFPSLSISCPLARPGNSTWARPVITSGYKTPNITVVTNVNHTAIRRFFFIGSSNNPKIRQQYVDKLDSDKRGNDSTHAIDQQVAAQQGRRTQWTIPHTAESERNQGDDDQSVENHRRENCRLRRAEMHYIQDAEQRKGSGQPRGDDGERIGHNLRDRESRQSTA